VAEQTQCPLPGKPHICRANGAWAVRLPYTLIRTEFIAVAYAHVSKRNGMREMTAVRVDGVRYSNAWDGLEAMGVPSERRRDVLRKLRRWGYVRWVTSHNSLANWREQRIEWCL